MGQDEEHSSVRVEDRGFTTLHQPRDEQSVIADLVFVHGLQGHPRRTWQSLVTPQEHISSSNPFKRRRVQPKDHDKAGVFWPADLIPQDYPNLRVLTYGYDSRVTGYYASSTSKNGIFEHGNSLLNALSRERTDQLTRPIILVAHSLGGLVVKQALVEARKGASNRRLHDIYSSTHAVIFFGTPHRGSDAASWGLIASNIAKAAQMDVNDAILRDLDPASGSSKLLELRRDFHDILQDPRQQSPLQLYTFQEELGMTSLGALGGKVVANESSSFDSPDYGFNSIHANHMNMCRFTGITDDGYRKFRDSLSSYVQALADKRAVDEQAERQVQRESLDDLMRTLDFAERRSREYQLRNLDTDQSSFSWIWSSALADWLSSPHPLFWLRGKPASGKSTLTQYLVDNDRTYSKLQGYRDCEWLTIYFFFDFRGGEGITNNFVGLLRSFLVQLLDSMPELRKYAQCESSTQWHEARLRECLLSVFDHSPKGLCLFIDGLDEYEGNLLQLLRFLKKLQTVDENSPAPRKIYVSSRPEPLPSELLEGTPGLSMSEENRQGIGAYVQSIMKEMPSEIAKDSQWRSLCDEIVKRADGVFLWARLALDELVQGFCEGENIDELSDRLESVPDELEGIYKRIIDRMEPQARNEAFVVLQITCYRQKDLTLQDFLVAMNFTMETDLSIRRSVGRSELQVFSRRVRAKVGGLLEMIERADVYDVKLIHKTVKTFLDKCGWQLLQPQKQILPCDGDFLLLKACIKYSKLALCSTKTRDSLGSFENESSVTKHVTRGDAESSYPFLRYSALAIFDHARQLETVGNVSSYAYIKEVLTPEFHYLHQAINRNSKLLPECSCDLRLPGERFPYNITSPFAHGLPKSCEEIICTHTGDESFWTDEALFRAIDSSFIARNETYYLPYWLNTISLVLGKVTQIKQSHLEQAMAIPAPADVLRLLLGQRSFENLQIFTDDGRRATLLWLFICSKKMYMCGSLFFANLDTIIEKGEDVNGPCGPDGTALDYAVRLEDEFVGAEMIASLVSCGAYKTVNPDTLLKAIKMYDARHEWRTTALRTYLAGEDGFDPVKCIDLANRESRAGLLSNNS